MKKTIYTLSALTIAAALTAGFTACTNDITAEQPVEQPVKTFTVNIPATMPADDTRAVAIDGTVCTSTFNSTEKVYVYNATTDEVMGGYLQPTDISADGKSCKLAGTLTGAGTISAGDELRLFYNLSHVNTNKEGDLYKYYTYFSYDYQNGTLSNLCDGAEATVTVSSYTDGSLTTTATASFQNLQSMFRFQFVDENNTPISVKTLKIGSYKGILRTSYRAVQGEYSKGDYRITLGTATTDYVYVAISLDENIGNDTWTFTVTDGDDNLYIGTRTAPSGGFKNGKYYYNTSAIQLTKQIPYSKPDITWTSVDEIVEPNLYRRYEIHGPWNNSTSSYEPAEITLSGNSNGYYFNMLDGGSTIHLVNLTATKEENNVFIQSYYGDLYLDISGANAIICKENSQTVSVTGNLKLSGNGTLTLTTNSASRYGILASGNYHDNAYNDVSVLAATTNTTVTRSATKDNGDGTYSWTYTVVTNP